MEITAINEDLLIKNDTPYRAMVASSKEENLRFEVVYDLSRSKRLFNNFFAFTTTTTIYSFITSALTRQINVVSVSGNSARCNGMNSFACLICVPSGYGVC